MAKELELTWDDRREQSASASGFVDSVTYDFAQTFDVQNDPLTWGGFSFHTHVFGDYLRTFRSDSVERKDLLF